MDSLVPVGIVRSSLKSREEAPKFNTEGAPDAWVEIDPAVRDALHGLVVGQDIILITWFHQSHRDVLQVHPRGDLRRPLTGVFATRSPDRPNPLGLHRVTILELDGTLMKVGPLEAIDGTPIVDIKPVVAETTDH